MSLKGTKAITTLVNEFEFPEEEEVSEVTRRFFEDVFLSRFNGKFKYIDCPECENYMLRMRSAVEEIQSSNTIEPVLKRVYINLLIRETSKLIRELV